MGKVHEKVIAWINASDCAVDIVKAFGISRSMVDSMKKRYGEV